MLRGLILFTTLAAIFLVIGFFIGGFYGLIVAFLFAMLLNIFAYYYSDSIVLRIYGAKELKDEKIHKMVKRLAEKAGLPVPRLYVIEQQSPNAFATGRNPKHAAIAITRGLLTFDENEIEGVLAHEIAHIKNRDCLLATIAAMFATAISFLAQIGYWSMFDRERGANLIGIFLIVLFAPLAATLIRLAISRDREYLADRTGVYITKKPHALASALRRIAEEVHRNPMRGSTSTSHLWIVNPFKSDWFTELFSTHPSIEKRIARLEEMEKK
ncbi:MAG: zinc metalloprotease HtpX [Candidatus Aenigmatarchaeota archaeon]